MLQPVRWDRAPVNVSSGQSSGKLANDLNTEDSNGGATIPSSSTIVPLPKRIGRYSIHEVLGLGGWALFIEGSMKH